MLVVYLLSLSVVALASVKYGARQTSGIKPASGTLRSNKYLTQLTIEFLRGLREKEDEYIKILFKNSKKVIEEMARDNGLAFLRELKRFFMEGVSSYLMDTDPPEIKSHAGYVLHYLNNAGNNYTKKNPKVELISFGDHFITQDDAQRMLSVVEDFYEFPKVNKTGLRMCQDILENLLWPFKRASNSPLYDNFYTILLEDIKETYPEYFRPARKPLIVNLTLRFD